MMRDRQYFLDILRVAATCAVVLMHTLTGAVDAVDISRYPAERLVYLVVMDLITWCVPIFVLISGYLFLDPCRRITWKQMMQKYCRRIVLALFLFGVPYAILELMVVEGGFRLSMIGEGILLVLKGQSWSHMWYLYLILLLYLITPGLKWLMARLPLAAVYGILAVLVTGSSILPFVNKLRGISLPVLPDGVIYFFYYICGYLFAGKKNQPSAQRKGWLVSAIPSMLVLVLAGMAVSRIFGAFSLQMAYNYPFTVLASLLLFQAAKDRYRRPGERAARLWQDASDISFAVYLVHPVFVNVLYKFLHISLLDFPIGCSLPVFFLAILALSAAAAWILCRIPLLKKFVL